MSVEKLPPFIIGIWQSSFFRRDVLDPIKSLKHFPVDENELFAKYAEYTGQNGFYVPKTSQDEIFVTINILFDRQNRNLRVKYG